MGKFKKREVVTLETLPECVTNVWNWWLLCDIAFYHEPVHNDRRRGKGKRLVYNVPSRFGNIRAELLLRGGPTTVSFIVGRSFTVTIESHYDFLYNEVFEGDDGKTQITKFDLIGDTTFDDVEHLMMMYSLTRDEMKNANA